MSESIDRGTLDYRFGDLEELDVDVDAETIEQAREVALDIVDERSPEASEEYRSGWIDAIIMFDRLLTDPEYFGLSNDA